jgi:hypothetical protein
MPQVVEAGAHAADRGGPRHGQPQQLVERVPHRPVGQRPAGLRREEGRDHRPSVLISAGRGVVAQRPEGGRVQRDEPGLVELGPSDGQDAGLRVDIVGP